ncbi:MAG: phosphoenolpyruvate carboxykinase (ATP) [Acidobacteriota bacterium]
MENHGPSISRHGLEPLGLAGARTAYWNLPVAALYEQAVRRGEAEVAEHGPLLCKTGEHTGRSPNDKFTVKEAGSEADIWWGKHNRPISEAQFDALLARAGEFVEGKDLFVFDGYAGADPAYRLSVRVVSQYAWHSIFVRNMFLRESDGVKLESHLPGFTVIDLPGLKADPAVDGTASSTFILLNLKKKIVLIGGTEYAGEMKKSIFSVMNYLLPKQGVLSMHCSANYGKTQDDVALFFGLSGTGKTTLSADAARALIGDDEHGWSDHGVFNIEGGCYAKVIRLSADGEPEIYATTRRFGTILENVDYDATSRRLDLDSAKLTENTRASYMLDELHNVDLGGCAGHPKNVVFLTCDAFGVLPPISRLTPAQAMYHFMSGYTAKVAGTERGVTEPAVTFSTCFGAPFLPLHPTVYAKMLGEKLARHGARVWLVNTGWTGGGVGVGSRMKLRYTRRMVSAALAGELDQVPTANDPIFGLAIPVEIRDVPTEILTPRQTWADKSAYDAQAKKLAGMFVENFKQYADHAAAEVLAAAPKV